MHLRLIALVSNDKSRDCIVLCVVACLWVVVGLNFPHEGEWMDSAVHKKPLILPVRWSESLVIEGEVETEIPPVRSLVIRLGLESCVLRAVHPRRSRKMDSRNSLEIEAFNLLLLGRCKSLWELGPYREHHRHVASHVGLGLEWHAWARSNLAWGCGRRRHCVK
jgi:hypothetical protein